MISPRLEAVCLRALQKDRNDRYADAREMRAELRAAIGAPRSGEAVPTPSPVVQRAANESETLASGLAPPAVRRSVAPRRGARYSVAVAGAALAVLGLVSVVSHKRRTSSPPQPPPSSPVVAKELAPSPPPFTEAPLVQPVLAASRPPEPPPAPRPRAKPVPPPEATTESPVVARAPDPVAPSASPALLSPPAPSVATPPPALLTPPAASLPSAAPKPVVPSDGRVSWGVSAAGGGATAGNVGHALGRTAGAWQRCYQAALAATGARTTGNATLHLTCDDQGRVVGAKLAGFDLGPVAECIRASSNRGDDPQRRHRRGVGHRVSDVRGGRMRPGRFAATAAASALAGTLLACRGGSGDGMNVAAMPAPMQADYAVFAQKCSKCHSLSRPLESGITDDDFWMFYVERMRRQPASGIAVSDEPAILRFLHYYSQEKLHGHDAGAGDVE